MTDVKMDLSGDLVSLLKLISDIRWACGDKGRRMQPELVEYIGIEHDVLRVIADPHTTLPACVYKDMAAAALKAGLESNVR